MKIKTQEVPFFGTPCLLEKYFLERYACFRNVHCRCLSGCHKWWVSTCPKPHFTNLMGMVLAMPKDCLFHRHNLGNSHLDKIHRWPSPKVRSDSVVKPVKSHIRRCWWPAPVVSAHQQPQPLPFTFRSRGHCRFVGGQFLIWRKSDQCEVEVIL